MRVKRETTTKVEVEVEVASERPLEGPGRLSSPPLLIIDPTSSSDVRGYSQGRYPYFNLLCSPKELASDLCRPSRPLGVPPSSFSCGPTRAAKSQRDGGMSNKVARSNLRL